MQRPYLLCFTLCDFVSAVAVDGEIGVVALAAVAAAAAAVAAVVVACSHGPTGALTRAPSPRRCDALRRRVAVCAVSGDAAC